MDFKALFPVLDRYTYLNTAASGILASPVAEWRRQHDQDFYLRGSEFRLNQAETIRETKETVARFFNAKPGNTFLVPNFSFGFNTFLDGLPRSHRFLLLEEDYPSVNFPVQSRGFDCTLLLVTEQLEEQILHRIAKEKPTVFAFSLVQYLNGNKMSLAFIKKIKELYPDLLIVADGTQFCATEVFDFENSGLDVLIASAYKWMLAGYGNGIVLLRDTAAELLYTAAQADTRMPAEPFLLEKGLLSLYFEPGHQDTFAFGTLNQSLLLLEQLGMDKLEQQIKSLAIQARAAFTARGLLDASILLRAEHASIFSLQIEQRLFEKLLEAQILCVSRGKGTRVSFHFYNTENDLARLLEVIDSHR